MTIIEMAKQSGFGTSNDEILVGEYGNYYAINTELEAFANLIRADERAKFGWVSVKDKAPERIEGMKILCFGNGYIFEAEYEYGYWVNLGGDDFTHWMPLPSAPNELKE